MHSKRWKLAVLGLLLAVLLAGCLPEGGIFGHGGSSLFRLGDAAD